MADERIGRREQRRGLAAERRHREVTRALVGFVGRFPGAAQEEIFRPQAV